MSGDSRSGVRVTVVGGHSADAINEFVAALPINAGYAVVVQAPDHISFIDDLRNLTKVAVVAGQTGMRLEANRIFVVPQAKDVSIRRGEIGITAASIPGVQLDRLLRSAADDCGRDAIAVILRGAGSDGAIGIKRIKENGGMAFAEEPETGTAGEMPRAAIATGIVDRIAAAPELAMLLGRLGHDEEKPSLFDDDDRKTGPDVTDTLRDILSLVRIRSGHDFSAYKRATLYRRVARRMQVCGTESIEQYHTHVREHPPELVHLLRDFLISVTNFFRDPEHFQALGRDVIPKLFAGRGHGDSVRVWVPGCATGEEAYSIGILLLEHADTLDDPPEIQIFATDIDEQSLGLARAGQYPGTIAADVSAERLATFFTAEGDGYRVSKDLRELVLFSPHNILRDPPFSRLDLVSCRNLLIYLNREAQARALALFHFGLKPEGFLFLGSSETAESSALFSGVDVKSRIFRRHIGPSPIGVETLVTGGRWHPPPLPALTAHVDRTSTFGEVHHRLVERYAPPSLIVNGDLEVVHLSEHAGKFFELAGGEPTRQILRMILPALRLDLRAAIYAARQSETHSDVRRVVFDDSGKRRSIELRVRALDLQELGPQALLIYLDESEPDGAAVTAKPGAGASIEPVVAELEHDLRRTREELRNSIEQYETSLEELKASNEELQAINEELRSASEELETSKEEIQSVNEELTTLNQELKSKIVEVTAANSDLQNLITSTDIGVLFLDRALHIKRFTPRALDLFNLIPSDVGRPIAHVTHNLDLHDIPDLAQRVLQNLRTIERDVQLKDGRRYLLRFLPYRSLEDRIEGVVLTFVDVSDLREAVAARRKSEAALVTSEVRLAAALRGAPVVVLTVGADGDLSWGHVLGNELAPGPLDSLDMLDAAGVEQFTRLVRETRTLGLGKRAELELRVDGTQRMYDMRFEPAGLEVSVVGFDISAAKSAESSLRDADRKKDEFLATLSHELRNPLTPLKLALDVAQASRDKPEQLAKSHAIMERQVDVLSTLVDELLDLSRITQGKIELSTTTLDPAVIVDAALEATRPLIRERDHQLKLTLPAPGTRIVGDQVRLTQVLTNLLSNAAKYTPAGGKIDLSLAADEARHVLIIRVRDTGIGIPADMLSRIFDIFVQCRDDDGRARGGLGIGLNLVKRLVELHGGTVSAASAGPNQGAELTVELPLLDRI